MSLFRWITVFFTVTAIFTAPAFAANVLLLDDDFGTEVRDDLVSAGHDVTPVLYYDWDGSNPSPAGFDVVILLKGDNYGYEIGDDENSPAYAALLQFVQSGGVFASTEWQIYDMGDGGVALGLDPIVPFDYTTYEDYNYGGSYSVLIPGHPLAAGLPASWDTYDSADGGSCADPRPGATVVLSRFMDYDTQDCMDAFGLAFIGIGQGVSIHLNSDLGHEDGETATPELLQILRNIAAYNPSAPGGPIPVPLASPWALLLLTAVLGVLGASRVRRY